MQRPLPVEEGPTGPPVGRLLRPRSWLLWMRPRNWIVYTLITQVAAIVLTVLASLHVQVTTDHLVRFAILLALGVAQAEISRKIERVRRRLSKTPHVNMTSVWIVPGALLLPPQLAAVLAALLYLHLGIRSWYRLHHVAAHRTTANAANMVLSGLAAGYVVHFSPVDIGESGSAIYIAAAALTFAAVNSLITAFGLYLGSTENRSIATLFGSWQDNALELATICLGCLLVVTLVEEPALSVAVYLPLYVVHRSVLVKQLEELASTDQKTGLLNAVTWHSLAERELSRAQRSRGHVGVLMIDLDHFKRVNDTHGHIAGDAVLKAVAALVKAAAGDYDSVGRFGGEEFVVLLPGVTPVHAMALAERIRRAVEVLSVEASGSRDETVVITGLSASIGVAVYPFAGTSLDEVLLAADAATYHAKDTGRNTVVPWHALT